MLEVFGQNPENTKSIHEAKFGELKDLISGFFCTNRALFYKSSNCLQKEPVQQGTIKLLIMVNMLQEHAWFVKEVTTPLRYIILNEIFFNFNDDYVHKWLCNYNQYFDIEEIHDFEKFKVASYYL